MTSVRPYREKISFRKPRRNGVYAGRQRREQDGWPAARLLPLLAALRELLPWVRQRHDAPDPDYGVGMGDYFAGFLDEEARALGLSDDAIRGWAPAETRRRGGRRKAAR